MVTPIGITLFLGSGASASAGLPTTNTLMNTLISRHQDDKHSFLTEYRHSDIEVLDDDMRKIEQSQNKIVNHLRGQYDLRFLETIPKLRQEIRNYLFTELQPNQGRESEYRLLLGECIRVMLKNDPKTKIITTNYDMLVERTCAVLDMVVTDGFRKSASNMSEIWDGYWPDNDGVELVKLHGSINWHMIDDEVTKESMPSIHEPEADILIAPTLESKTYVNKPFDDLWKRFRHILESTSLLVVIGFSFRDEKLVKRINEFVEYGLTVLSISPTATSDAKEKFERYVALSYSKEKILSDENNYSPIYTFNSLFANDKLSSIILALDYVVDAIHKHNYATSYTEI